MNRTVPCVLAIGGTDPSGGAGLTADARALAAFGAHALPIVSAVVAQNTQGVAQIEAISPQMLRAQIETLLADVAPQAAKIGMLPNVEAVKVVAELLRDSQIPIVLDTVFAPSQGRIFSDEGTIEAIAKQLLPLCQIVTPNLKEAAQLCGFEVGNVPQMRDAARQIAERFGPKCVLVKGGHLEGDAIDVFWDGEEFAELRAPRIAGIEVRGTGCLLASAIAAQLAQNVAPLEACQRAKTWLHAQIQNAQSIGQGRRAAV